MYFFDWRPRWMSQLWRAQAGLWSSSLRPLPRQRLFSLRCLRMSALRKRISHSEEYWERRRLGCLGSWETDSQEYLGASEQPIQQRRSRKEPRDSCG